MAEISAGVCSETWAFSGAPRSSGSDPHPGWKRVFQRRASRQEGEETPERQLHPEEEFVLQPARNQTERGLLQTPGQTLRQLVGRMSLTLLLTLGQTHPVLGLRSCGSFTCRWRDTSWTGSCREERLRESVLWPEDRKQRGRRSNTFKSTFETAAS